MTKKPKRERADKLSEGDIVFAACGCRLAVLGFERYPLQGELRVLMRLVKLCPGLWMISAPATGVTTSGCRFFGERRIGRFMRIDPSDRFEIDDFASVLNRSFSGDDGESPSP